MVEHPPKGWHNRGYLPHFDAAGVYQMITYRLADSLPKHVIQKLINDSDNDLERRKQYELKLDTHLGSCILKKSNVAQIVLDAWMHWHKQKYNLIAYTIMPNHVHLIIDHFSQSSLGTLVHSWKSFTAKEINKRLQCSGPVWSKDYWDRYIRDETHYNNAVQYILENPVKAGLTSSPEAWEFSGIL